MATLNQECDLCKNASESYIPVLKNEETLFTTWHNQLLFGGYLSKKHDENVSINLCLKCYGTVAVYRKFLAKCMQTQRYLLNQQFQANEGTEEKPQCRLCRNIIKDFGVPLKGPEGDLTLLKMVKSLTGLEMKDVTHRSLNNPLPTVICMNSYWHLQIFSKFQKDHQKNYEAYLTRMGEQDVNEVMKNLDGYEPLNLIQEDSVPHIPSINEYKQSTQTGTREPLQVPATRKKSTVNESRASAFDRSFYGIKFGVRSVKKLQHPIENAELAADKTVNGSQKPSNKKSLGVNGLLKLPGIVTVIESKEALKEESASGGASHEDVTAEKLNQFQN